MRLILVVIFLAYAAAAVIDGVAGVAKLAALALLGSGLALIVDSIWHLLQERASKRRIHARLFRHACPDCGDVHGGLIR